MFFPPLDQPIAYRDAKSGCTVLSRGKRPDGLMAGPRRGFDVGLAPPARMDEKAKV
ncbi:hypothetical protein IF2G_02476 [Cordyceps javanica]|nr:hypothetical protein IF2G_02476 [Cordyceps javanica]